LFGRLRTPRNRHRKDAQGPEERMAAVMKKKTKYSIP